MKSHALAPILGAGLLGLICLLGGCSHEGSPGTGDLLTPDDQTIDLNDPFGGFLPVDEPPAFADSALVAATTEDERQEDGYAGLTIQERAEVTRIENGPHIWYSFTAIWGDLRNGEAGSSIVHPEEGDPVVWDGGMTLSEGAIRLLNVIHFERPEDGVLPRNSREKIEWTSVTHGDIDGIRVLLVLPRDTGVTAEPETLRFQADGYERVFVTDELENLNQVVDLSETQQVSFRAFRADPAVEVRGFCRGNWGWAAADSVGRFRGTFVRGDDGRLVGHIRGHYGVNTTGERVFFGKYIDVAGRFRGFLRGTWEATVEGTEGTEGFRETGEFAGRWVDDRGNALGELSGRWSRRGAHSGVFTGMWRGYWIVP